MESEKALELVHSDICGPINPSSNRGKRYKITFIDEYSRKFGSTSWRKNLKPL